MKYQQISSDLFIKNRQKFSKYLINNSLAIFNSNDIYPISADSTIPFKQHRDIFYLSGIDQEESILIIFPDSKNEEFKEILFLKETNEHIKIWEGEKLTKQKATEISGIKTIYWLQDFDRVLINLMAQTENVYLNINEHLRANTIVQTREDRFIKDLMNRFPIHSYKRSNPILHGLRAIKEPQEIDLIQKACNITEKGFRRLLSFVKPNVWEYEIEAELIHEFIKNRSQGFAYTPIIASGNNANVLHYIQNNNQCKKGELILLDVAAEYANYSSDLTRVIPVDGKFTSRQKQVYQAVLNIKNEATKLLIPGTLFKDFNIEVGKIVTSELLDLKLLDLTDVKNQDEKFPAYKKYFMHGTSHFLGLDTHDYGFFDEPIQENMVFTVEPGIYIPQEGFGIRLEDNIVVQKQGNPFNLMKNIPIEIEEIETLMN